MRRYLPYFERFKSKHEHRVKDKRKLGIKHKPEGLNFTEENQMKKHHTGITYDGDGNKKVHGKLAHHQHHHTHLSGHPKKHHPGISEHFVAPKVGHQDEYHPGAGYEKNVEHGKMSDRFHASALKHIVD